VNALITGFGIALLCLVVAIPLIRQARRLKQPVVDLGQQGFLVPVLLVLAAMGVLIGLAGVASVLLGTIAQLRGP
jgi:hypothetical protein